MSSVSNCVKPICTKHSRARGRREEQDENDSDRERIEPLVLLMADQVQQNTERGDHRCDTNQG